MATTTIHNTDLMDRTSKTGMYWSIAAILLAIIAGALMFMSPRNNATTNANEGNNMTNTNSGYMNTDTQK